MGIEAIGNASTAIFEQNLRTQKAETAGSLAFGTTETAGSLAVNNVGGSFCAMA